jgi:GTP cyclohydrolase I
MTIPENQKFNDNLEKALKALEKALENLPINGRDESLMEKAARITDLANELLDGLTVV